MKKLLLSAIAMVASVGAWAQDVYFSQDYEADGVTADWTTGTSGRFTPVILTEEGNHFLSVEQSTRNNNGAILTSTSIQDKVEAGGDFTMTFDMRLSSSSNQTATEFKIYDAANSAIMLSLKETGTWATTWTLNGTSTTITLPNSNKAGGSNTIADVTWCSYKISRSAGVTYLTITNKETDQVILERTIVEGTSETGGLGKMQFVSSRYLANFAIDNIVVREVQDGDVPAAVPTTLTIKYVDEDNNTIQDDVVVNTIAGIEVSASESQTAAIYTNDKKYIYKSGNTPITTAEDETANVITLVYREAAIWSYSVNAVYGEETILAAITSGSNFEEESIDVPYPYYVTAQGVLYSKDATNKEFHDSFTLVENNQVVNFGYKAVENVSNVVFLAEGENIDGMTVSTTGNIPIRASNTKAGVSSEDVVITTLQPGKYILHVGAFTSKSSGYDDIKVKVGYGQTVIDFATGSNLNETASDEIVLTLPTPIKYFGTISSGDAQLDYIWIEKTGDVTEEDITLKSVFLKPGVWAADGARFAAYAYADGNNTVWADFAAVEGDEGVYTATVNAEYTGLILVRLNGETTENNWDNKWNQTDDINFAEAADSTLYTITGWGEGENAPSTYEASKYVAPEPEPEPVLNTYTVQFINGAKWNKVNAYAWSGEGEQAVPVRAWPGTELTEPADTVINDVTYGLYTYTFQAEAAPEYIIFNNIEEDVVAAQTDDLIFKADSIYTWGVPEPEPIVETAYYLIGAFNQWNDETKVAFTKGDDGNFTLTYTFSGQFKILDQDGNWLGAGTENSYYQLTEDNSDVGLVDGNNLYLESEAEYTLTIDGSIMTVTGFPAESEPVYTVVGNYVVNQENTTYIFGESWAILEANDMEADQDNEGFYTKTYHVDMLPVGTIVYKVVKNHSWDNAWGFPGNGSDGNADYVVRTDDESPALANVTITFTFNPTVAFNDGYYVQCTVTGTPTGISNVAGQRTEQFIYSVQGVKLQKAQKGLNIINGRKVVVK